MVNQYKKNRDHVATWLFGGSIFQAGRTGNAKALGCEYARYFQKRARRPTYLE